MGSHLNDDEAQVDREGLAPILDKAGSAYRMAGEVQAAQEMRKRLDRRIHRQRLALRQTWEIVGARIGISTRSRLYTLVKKRYHAIRDAEARADRLSAEVEALREALKPFDAALADDSFGWPDEFAFGRGIRFGHLRAARTALARAAVKAETEGSDHG